MAENKSGKTAASMGDQAKAAGNAMAENSAQLSMKMLDQAETNTIEAFRAMREAAQAKDLSDVMRVQSDYLRDQGSRSMSQAREIGEMIAAFGRNTLSDFTRR